MNNFLTNKRKMFQVLKELDAERKEGGIKFERILKYYYPLFVEYGSLKLEALQEWEERLKQAKESQNAFRRRAQPSPLGENAQVGSERPLA